MKKLIALLGVFISLHAYSQKSAIQTALNYLNYGELDKAKEAIDGAAVNETTINMSKTWYVRGKIYHAIHESTDAKYSGLKPGALQEALNSYQKTMELDAKKEYKEEMMQRLAVAASALMNEGVNAFRDKKYAEALVFFNKSRDINSKYLNYTDTLAIYNSALAAEKSGKKKEAIDDLTTLTGMNYGGAKIYGLLANLQLENKDTTAALTTINAGRQKHPEDNNLVIQGLNVYLQSGRDKEAYEQLDAAIQKDPGNANLYYAKGVLSDKMGKTEEAAAMYKKAIELKPDYFEANYNLGAMYFNQGAELVNKANNLPVSKQAEYEAAKKKYEAKFREAQPYLEKAYQLNAKDEATIQSLYQLYGRIGNTAKAQEMKVALDGLKK
jgi:tetratricopeptide (TPR) repeat protein